MTSLKAAVRDHYWTQSTATALINNFRQEAAESLGRGRTGSSQRAGAEMNLLPASFLSPIKHVRAPDTS